MKRFGYACSARNIGGMECVSFGSPTGAAKSTKTSQCGLSKAADSIAQACLRKYAEDYEFFFWIYLSLIIYFYLAFKWTKPSFEQDVSWKKIERPGVGFLFDSNTSSKKFIDERSSPMAGTFKWKHSLARAIFGVRNVQMSMVNADPVIIVSRNVRPVGRINVDTKRRIFYGLNWIDWKKFNHFNNELNTFSLWCSPMYVFQTLWIYLQRVFICNWWKCENTLTTITMEMCSNLV